MQRLSRWFLMLNKRLYKKLSFIIILFLIPVLILTFSYVSKQDSGLLTIALAQVDKSDQISTDVINELQKEDSVIRFVTVATPQDAFDMVKSSAADEAWIFSENMQEKIDAFMKGDSTSQSTVTVVCKDQSAIMNIANEKLSGTMYKHYAKSYYLSFIRDNLSQLDSLSDEELIEYFDNVKLNEELFVFANADGSAISEPDTNYLFSPVRGLLAILIVLCGMAATMYFMQDEKFGTFSFVKDQNKIYVSFFCILIAVLNISFFVFISLMITDKDAVFIRELFNIIMYTLCVSSFCLLVKQIFRSLKTYSCVIVLLVVAMIAVCPVFFDFRSIMWLQLVFPPTYYINAAYDSIYILYMAIYSCVAFGICFASHNLKKKLTLK